MKPGIYTRVSTYHGFIKKIIRENRRQRNGATPARALSSKQKNKWWSATSLVLRVSKEQTLTLIHALYDRLVYAII
jgi:hypothetical protein